MFSYFYSSSSSSSKTRFESSPELRDLIPTLTKLRQHEQYLKTLVDKNAAHEAYRKSKILTQIVPQLDKLIEEFNTPRTSKSDLEELNSMLNFVKNIQRIIQNNLTEYEPILNEPRSGKKPLARKTIKTTALAGGIGAGMATGSIFVGFVGTLGVSPLVSNKVIYMTGLDDDRTTSIKILEELGQQLERIRSSLSFQIELIFEKKQDDAAPLVCPITQTKIKIPVLCTLDGRMYEKTAIETWLNEKRKSPYNRAEMKEGQSVKDVLIENISLREAIEELGKIQHESSSRSSSESEKKEDNRKEGEESKGNKESKEEAHPTLRPK